MDETGSFNGFVDCPVSVCVCIRTCEIGSACSAQTHTTPTSIVRDEEWRV